MRFLPIKSALKYPAIFLLAVFFCLLFSSPGWSALPEPASGGRFFASKGTKLKTAYRGLIGRPSHQYGEGLELGIVHLKPSLNYSYEWDDNIFRSSDGEESDFIHRLEPGVRAEVPFSGEQHLVYAEYLAEIEWFQRHTGQDHDDHQVQVGAELNFVPFSLAVEEQFRRTVNRTETEFTDRVERNENTARGLLEIPFAAFFLETEAMDFDIDYDKEEGFREFDHNIFTVYQRVGVDVAPSTQALAEYAYTNIDYSEVDGRNGNAHEGSLGLRGMLGEYITYQLWGGAQWRVYDEDARPDFNDFIFRGAVRYTITDLNELILWFHRKPVESIFDEQSFYVRNRIEVEWRRRLAERVVFYTRGGFSYNEYASDATFRGETKTRQDDVWHGAAGLEYVMPNDRLSFFGEYRYWSRDSNFNTFDYDDQTVTVGARFAY